MAATAEERISALTRSEENFSLAVPFAARSENRIDENSLEGKKTHQGIFFKNRTIASGATRAKWSGTHQDSGRSWWKTVLGGAIDANGNTLSDPSGKSYSWDFENRLTQAVVPGTGTVTFKYDPFGRRIQKSGPLGTTNYEARAGQKVRVRVHIASFGRRLLSAKKSVRVTLTATSVSEGLTATVTRAIALKAQTR